ncbi:hypothetical protein RR48_07401 [Papilio machaon]|uniref:Uncharacterized protein n=1 Tax=Papilio machaon TaxID=76193 RepID=A0A194RQN9_PAPMA|nr:hypothetical protein RR48_07401 [Papilio machaon]
MKVSAFLFMFLAVLALFVGSSTAAPKLNVGAIKKGGKVIRKGFGVLSAAGTAHEVYNHSTFFQGALAVSAVQQALQNGRSKHKHSPSTVKH